jgi:putative membrane protein
MKRNAQKLAGLLAIGVLGLVPVAIAQNDANRMTADNSFAAKAAQANMAEVKLGQLAEQHAENSNVKSFAQRMIDDHSKNLDQLKQVAEHKGITLPTDISAKDQATYDQLSRLNGAAFDKAYTRDMVSDHENDISEFRQEANHGTDADLKAYANQTLPTLEEHLRLAKTAEADVKGEK